MRHGIVLSQEGGNLQRNGNLTVDELESVSDGNANRSSAQWVGVPCLDDYTFQANADLEKGKHTNSQDGTIVGRKMVQCISHLWRLVLVIGIHHYYCRMRIPS